LQIKILKGVFRIENVLSTTTNNATPGKTLSEIVRSKLGEILESSDFIKFVALVTMDGFTISSAMRDNINVNPKWLGALIVSSIKNLEGNIRKALGNASLSELVISLGQDMLIIKSMGKLALLIIADKSLGIDFIMYEVEEGLRDLMISLGLSNNSF
jgi:predicted regulator of Ras-like GTPase activity (Roadblock/LC7/MglB family)